jgi:hypothetical protein
VCSLGELEMLTLKEITEYEIRASTWAHFRGWIEAPDWLCQLAADYYIWKSRRKHKRYLRSIEIADFVKRNIFTP